METIAWIGLSQSLFAAILIGTKKDNSVSDKLLTGWLSLLAIEFFTCVIDYKVFEFPLLSNSFLLFNPAFYLYIKSLTNRKFSLKYLHLLHLVPYTIFEVSIYILGEPLSLSSFFYNTDGNLYFRIIFGIASFLSWALYNSSSYALVKRHRQSLEDELSNIERNLKMNWILFLVIFYFCGCIITFLLGFYAVSIDISAQLAHIFNYSMMLLLVYILGYYGLMQKRIFFKKIDNTVPVKYQQSLLSSSKKEKIKQQIINYFENEKPYLNQDLHMDSLSKKLNIPKHQLTEVLNVVIGKNFFQFVNAYRIGAVKEMLNDKSNPYSIEAIAYECGFSSKSSFFTIFKKMTGCTPSQYKNKDGTVDKT